MPASSAASAFCRSLPVCSACFCCSAASPALGCARAASNSVGPYWTGYAFKSAFGQFRKQQAIRINRTRHDRAPARNTLKAALLIIGFVSDQNDEAVAFVLRFFQRAFDQ